MKIILILVMLSNHFIVDEEMVRTRPTGGYRKEYGTWWYFVVFSDTFKKDIKKHRVVVILLCSVSSEIIFTQGLTNGNESDIL